MKRIACNNIDYRKGFVEISENIHDGLINLETWSIHPDFSIKNRDLGDADFPDSVVTGNTEIELSIDDAKSLIKLLESAINKMA